MITKRDDRRYRFAIAMASHRTLWARIAFKQVAKAHKFDRNHVTQIMRATDSPEAALERIKTYFEGQSRVYWANALRIVWKETGKAAIAVTHDVLTGKDFMRSVTSMSFCGPQNMKQDPVVTGVQSAWDLFVEDKITSRANKVVGVTHMRASSRAARVASQLGVAGFSGSAFSLRSGRFAAACT